ncbi:MAG: NUDIX hydrolase [Anaerolineae bacterium]|nr:NUDIX hydrolase [Anaerolineae bacterium]
MDGDRADRVGRWQRRVAGLLRRYPWTSMALQRTVRLVQPRFTCGVVGVLLDAEARRVLLVEHVYHGRTPWGLPGGWIARDENPAHTAEREFAEETGLRVRAVRPLLVVLGTHWRRHLDVVFLLEQDGAGQTIRLCDELLSYRWAAPDELPPVVALHREAIALALEAPDGRCVMAE